MHFFLLIYKLLKTGPCDVRHFLNARSKLTCLGLEVVPDSDHGGQVDQAQAEPADHAICDHQHWYIY